MQFETMGLLVVRKTYSIAVACLSPQVIEAAPEDLFGQILIINEPVSKWVGGSEDRPPTLSMDVQNLLYEPRNFNFTYKVVGPDSVDQAPKGVFFRVKRLRQNEIEKLLEEDSGRPIRNGPAYHYGKLRPPALRALARGGYAW